MKIKKQSDTVIMHYVKLILRSILFIAALVAYILNRVRGTGEFFGGYEDNGFVLSLLWVWFVVEMVLRFFPARLESMGCQKQFKRNYKPTGSSGVTQRDISHGVILALGAWISLNAVIAVLYFTSVIDKGILLLISLAYSVCDIICILFFCPFQTWFMKNKCCKTCRIYNWDYAMMFTPLAFIDNIYAISLFALAVALLVKWELTAFLHPERFSECTNASLACRDCHEKLCHHKHQLKKFLKNGKFNLAGNTLFVKIKSITSKGGEGRSNPDTHIDEDNGEQ